MQPFSPSRSLTASFHAIVLRLSAVAALGLSCVACGAHVCVSSPSVVSTTPTVVASGGASFTLTVNGSGFTPGMQVLVNGGDRQFQFVSSSRILLLITERDIATPGTVRIVVQSRTMNGVFVCGGVASSITLTIN